MSGRTTSALHNNSRTSTLNRCLVCSVYRSYSHEVLADTSLPTIWRLLILKETLITIFTDSILSSLMHAYYCFTKMLNKIPSRRSPLKHTISLTPSCYIFDVKDYSEARSPGVKHWFQTIGVSLNPICHLILRLRPIDCGHREEECTMPTR